MLRKSNWLLSLLVLTCFALSSSRLAVAQAPETLPSVEVDLWPEYDDPGVLVIYRITLPASMSLPAEFSLRIPKGAGEPNAVAVRDMNGDLMKTQFSLVPNGEWNTLKITATSPEIQVEYYDPGLNVNGRQRSYTYTWPGDYGVQALTLQVQQPWDASQMQISPDDFGTGVTGPDTLRYYTENIGSVPAGSPIKILLGYNKASDVLSLEQLKPTLVAPAAASNSQNSNLLPLAAGAVVIALLVVGAFWFVNSKNAASKKGSQARARHKPASQKHSSVPAAEEGQYCTNCGRRASSGDHFCRSCGTQLRQ